MIDRQKVNLVGNVLDGQHGDFLRTALSAVLQAVMDAQVNVACGAGYGERSPERANRRNGTRSRELHTRLGTIERDIPKLRQGTYLPPFLTPRQQLEPPTIGRADPGAGKRRRTRRRSPSTTPTRGGGSAPVVASRRGRDLLAWSAACELASTPSAPARAASSPARASGMPARPPNGVRSNTRRSPTPPARARVPWSVRPGHPASAFPSFGSRKDQALRSRLARARERSEVKAFTPHGLWRMVVDRMLRAGVDPATAASVMGRSVVVMLRFYPQVTEADREAAVAKAALAAFPTVEKSLEQHGLG